MFLCLPLGVEEATVDRVPWVSITIAALCAVMFAITWVLPANPEGGDEGEFQGVLEYWKDHPYLELPQPFLDRYVSDRGRRIYETMHQKALDDAPVPSASAAQQATLERLVQGLLNASEHTLLRRLSLVPRRGLAQPGWLTHMFLHFGWMHILGNLLFFYLVAPLLEDIWGRPLFTGFYLVGGLFAALAHYLLDRSSVAAMAGASGAIAACMGAFTLRYASRKIRMGYILFLLFFWRRGTFLLPAWLWGAFWFASEVFDFWGNRGNNGVAVMAHIGGFAFGFAVAVGLKTSGLEAKYVAPLVQGKTGEWTQHPGLAEAAEALDRGDDAAAERAFQRVLADKPEDREALLGLARLELESGRAATGMARASRLLEKQLAAGSDDGVYAVMQELGPQASPAHLRPAFAYRVAQALERVPEAGKPGALPLYLAAKAAGGAIGAKALLRAAQIRLEGGERSRAEEALGHVREARGLTGVPPELMAQLETLDAQLSGQVASRSRGAAEALEEEARDAMKARPRLAPRVLSCRVVGLSATALSLQPAAGNVRPVELSRVLGVGVGITPGPATADGTPPRRVLQTDLILDWGDAGRAATVLRIPSSALGLASAFPGVPVREAYGRFLAHVLQASGALALPDHPAISRGEYPSFPSEQAMTNALYGTA